ncbi:MAG TPA: twin-arginine translocase TatA/TatE family subunit [Ignavibacteriaceae bacterium]|jgi:sec-independent protein translocase protein TatA|nr:twin-arginine translocase TatA/TatE family subunit [Ignavibacteriaceae bacterium]
MFEDLSFGKLLIILLVVMVLFGSKKIPDLAQGLGKGIREFKKALKDVDEEIKTPASTPDKKPDDKEA